MLLTRVTVLRLDESRSIPLRKRHHARLGPDGAAALEGFLEHVETPGLFRVTWNGRLSMTRLSASRLTEGIAVRFERSPFSTLDGAFPKPASPSAYDSLRLPALATLLTDSTGSEMYESCSAAIVAWNGKQLVLPPQDRPRVDSLAEQAVAASEPCLRAPIEAASSWPVLLINAAASCEPQWNGRDPFPRDVRARLAALLSKEDA